jgi:hypothetical protein
MPRRSAAVADFQGSAVFSPCERYRYRLERTWQSDAPDVPVTFLMLNPSTATALADDPTIAKCGRYVRKWGARRLIVANIFALRSTDPRNLLVEQDPVGPDNDDAIVQAVRDSAKTICAWGNWGCERDRSKRVVQILRDARLADRLYFLRMNKTMEPQHPLYLPGNLEPVRWFP